MKDLERRQTPRMKIEGHAYINIEPNNGGIVLNVSSGGLCFHSFDPVKRNGPVRFWFSDRNQRIEADGELAWMDETQKGGLRFTNLPPEARQQILSWMRQPAMPLAAGGVSTPSVPPPRAFPLPNTSRPDATTAAVGYAPAAVVSPEKTVAPPLRGFSGGLATGLLIAAVVAAAFLFHNYRREFGESLIRLGEQFRATPQEQFETVPPPPTSVAAAPPVSPTPRVVLPAPETVLAPRQTAVAQAVPPPRQVASPAPQSKAPVSRSEKQPPEPLKIPQQAKLEPAAAVTTTAVAQPPVSDPATKAAPAATAPAISPAPPTVSLPTAGVAPVSNLLAANLGTVSPLAPASPPGVQAEDAGMANSLATSEMYFEIGKFKDEGHAHDTTDKLAQLGFPATAVQKGHLWRNAYHVLVGPYENEDKAKVTHEDLLSHGFKPQPFEKGSRSFSFRSRVMLNGAQTPEGDYTIRWESYVTDATVKFLRNDFVITTADGKWEKRDVKYPRDAYVYKRNPDGSRTLLEIHFGGMRKALVFGKPS